MHRLALLLLTVSLSAWPHVTVRWAACTQSLGPAPQPRNPSPGRDSGQGVFFKRFLGALSGAAKFRAISETEGASSQNITLKVVERAQLLHSGLRADVTQDS